MEPGLHLSVDARQFVLVCLYCMQHTIWDVFSTVPSLSERVLLFIRQTCQTGRRRLIGRDGPCVFFCEGTVLEVRLFLAFLGHTHSLAQRLESATLPTVSSNLLSSSLAKQKAFISLQLPHPAKKKGFSVQTCVLAQDHQDGESLMVLALLLTININ